MTKLTETDKKELLLADLYQGMLERNKFSDERVFNNDEFNSINEMIARLHEESSRL